MPSKDITMQDIKGSQNSIWFRFLPNCVLLSSSILSPLLPSKESQKNLTTTTMISMTITMPITFTEESGGISCKAVQTAGCVSCDVRDQFTRPHQAGDLGGCELVGGHKGPEGGGQGCRVQAFRSNHARCQAGQARMPHTVCNLMEGLFVQ